MSVHARGVRSFAVADPVVGRPEISVVIVTHESEAFIGACLRAVGATEFEGPLDVILVDNCSTDATVERAREAYPDLKVIRPAVRGGFARNANLGLAASSGRYAVLLNPDTALEPNALAILWGTLEARPEAAAVGPLLVDERGAREASARRFPSFAGTLLQSLMVDRLLGAIPGVGPDLGRHADHDRTVDWLTGACLMVRREALDGNEDHRRVGLLDERIFMFVEDTEWCWRLHRAGWQVLYTPRARVMHHKGSGEGFAEWRYLLNCRGHAYFFRKHRGRASAWIYQALLVPGLVLRAAGALAALPIWPSRRDEWVRRLMGYGRLGIRVLTGQLEQGEGAS